MRIERLSGCGRFVVSYNCVDRSLAIFALWLSSLHMLYSDVLMFVRVDYSTHASRHDGS